MVLDATVTNIFSNGLHATFLLLYFIGAVIHSLRNDNTFSLYMVCFFFSLFIAKLLGVYVHYYYLDKVKLEFAGDAISLIAILLNYFIIESIKLPNITKIFIMLISVIFSFLYIIHNGGFIYVAIPILIGSLLVAYYTKSMLRLGFIMVIISNVIWITARFLENYIAGHEISPAYRYDNDMYHLLLIISTFIIYKAVANGECRPSNSN